MRKTFLVLMIMVLGAGGALGATINVPAGHATIQGAINAANNGDVIMVAAGSYVQTAQLVINKDVSIVGAGKTLTTIAAGFNTTVGNYLVSDALIYVDYGVSASISDLAIDGTGFICRHGIQSRGTNLDVQDCDVSNMNAGTYFGRGIVFLTGTGLVKDVTMSNIYRIGVHIRGGIETVAPDVDVDGLTYTGKGVGDYLDYGVEFGGGGGGSVINSNISGCLGVATVDGSTSAGILVTDYYGTGTVAAVDGCTLTGNYSGMAVGYNATDGSVASIHNSDLSGNTNYGVTSTGPSVDASANWWGDFDPTDQIIGPVAVSPWFGAAPGADPMTWYVGAPGTIQGAVDVADPGDAIIVTAGTYPETVNVPVAGLSISGVDQTTVIIDPTGLATNNAGVYVAADDVTLSTLTLQSTVTTSLPRYGIKIGEQDGCSLVDVTVRDVYRSGVDALGSSSLTVTDVSILDNGGHGLSLVDCNDVAVTNLTATGNGWQNVSVATWGRYSTLGTSGIDFSGTNTFGDLFQLEMGDYNNPGVAPSGAAIITYSTNPGDMADVTVQSSDFGFAVHGEQDDSPDQVRIWFVSTLANAAMLPAAAPIGHWTGVGMYIEDLNDSAQYYVTPGCTIQAAIDAADPGDKIDVSAGTYVEALLIEKALTLNGATAGVNKNGYTVPTDYLWDDTVETVIQHPGGGYVTIVDIHDTSNVTFDGFVVGELNAVGNTNTSLVRVYAHTQEITNINVINNVIGPNTNVTSQDGAQGRMGLYIINHPYGDNGVVNSTFARNKIFDCKGNGDNIFLWTSYYAYGAPGPADMTGTVIENNEIYGSHRAGIETAGGFANLTIRNNTIYGQTGLPGDNPDFLKYGHGIQLIRGSSDKVSDPLTAFGPVNLTIEGNEIYGNQKCGIYMGPKNEDIFIEDNVIRDNGWNGVMLDLEGNYWNPQFESPPASGAYACYDCSEDVSVTENEIYGNGNGGHALAHYGVQLVGTPTNAFQIEAGSNWWGAASGPLDNSDDTGTGGLYNPGGQGDEVTDLVLYMPWVGVAEGDIVPVTTGPLNCSQNILLTFRYTADDYTPDLHLYDAVVTATPGLEFGDVENLFPFGTSNQYFFVVETGANEWTITGSTVAAPHDPVTGPGTTGLFTIEFSATSDVVGTVEMTSLTLRDPVNATIPVTLTGASITYDCTDPPAVTGITAVPGHNKVDVTWTQTSTDVATYRIYRGLWHNGTIGASAYPEYDDVAVYTPTYRPTDAADADSDARWVLAGTTAFGINSFEDVGAVLGSGTFDPDGDDRGVYSYEVFPVDLAANSGPGATANDRATNYWLGDVNATGPGTSPNGLVESHDMIALATAFGTSDGDGQYNNKTDVGPTDDLSRLGIPTTDDDIDFEDLMVFSMNFGIVSATKAPLPVSSMVDLAWVRYDDGRQALRLVNGSGVKGLNIRGDVQVSAVVAGDLLDAQSELTFLRNVGEGLDVSVSVMGINVGFAGSGDLFIVDAETEIDVNDLTIKVRGYDNSKLEFKMDETSGSLTPRVFALNPNYPNPFNPMTKISFSLPEAQDVRLEVYGVDGRRVATLLNETRGPGLHEVIWNGQDDSGRQAASGMYFYRINAGPYSEVHKMTLMK